MSAALLCLVAFVPAAALIAAVVPAQWGRANPRGVARIAVGLTTAGCVSALAAVLLLLDAGFDAKASAIVRLPGFFLIGVGLHFDALAAVMLMLVSFIGAAVVRFGATYMEGDPGHARFMQWLCATLAAVLALIVSATLPMLAGAWIATSLCLHRLLEFYPERPAAMRAAHKKFVVSRAGDACLLIAMGFAWPTFGTLELPGIFAGAAVLRETGVHPLSLDLMAVFLAVAAVLKSAQAPFHVWLTEVMETPTPVSALLHAGIINAGGFLVIRMSGVMSLAPDALTLLAAMGAVTAIVGCLAMPVQTSVKVSLAWSTVAQMGFMILQCGLGAFAAAALHLVAHALYKAHAFLSSGSVVDFVRAAPPVAKPGAELPLPVALAASSVLVVMIAGVFGVSPTQNAGVFAQAAVLAMGVSYLMVSTSRAAATPRGALGMLGAAGTVIVLYFVLQAGADGLLHAVLPVGAAPLGTFGAVLAIAVVLLFGVLLWAQGAVTGAPDALRWAGPYVLAINGFYLNAITDRLIDRAWPIAPAAPKGDRA